MRGRNRRVRLAALARQPALAPPADLHETSGVCAARRENQKKAKRGIVENLNVA
jgi:hypothetical protein